MRDRALAGIVIGFLVSLAWLGITYAGQQLANLPLLAFEFFEWLTRILPGGLITFALDNMIRALHRLQFGPTSSLGKSAEMTLAYLLALLILTSLGLLYALTLDRLSIAWPLRGLFSGTILALISLPLLQPLWWSWIVWQIWSFPLAWGVHHVSQTLKKKPQGARRRFLGQFAVGSLAFAGVAIGLGRWLSGQEREFAQALPTGTPIPLEPSPTPPATAAGFVAVPGTRPEITPIDEFYRVDINLLPPDQEDLSQAIDNLTRRLRAQGETDLPIDSYVLAVDGLVERPLTMSMNDLKTLPKVEQYATLACISNPVGGDLIGTTLFTGARLKDVLEKAGLNSSVIDIKFTCVDGYSESLPIDSAMDPRTLLCYAMGNQPLTRQHGAPLRLYTPDRFGMKNPKWIIKIEAVDEDYLGYWEQRGWSEQAWVQTTAVVDAADPENSKETQVGGIAFAGARGISRVEISPDGGPWQPVELNRPLSPLTWVLWRTSLNMAPGTHTLTVRTIDGQGQAQTSTASSTHPSGATGYYMKTIQV